MRVKVKETSNVQVRYEFTVDDLLTIYFYSSYIYYLPLVNSLDWEI